VGKTLLNVFFWVKKGMVLDVMLLNDAQ